jgi:histidinol-phosphate aminotransferase
VADVERIASSNPDNVIVIDEAYVDFGAESCLPLLGRYDNLLIVRTFSKSRALAGARLGFAFGSAEIISDLETLRFSTNPYSINRLTLKAGESAIDSDDYFMNNCKRIEATREETVTSLESLGFTVIPSKANFIFAKHDSISGERLYLILKDKGILVRHFSDPLISDYNRITIGSETEMKTFVETVAVILKEECR